jgi:uncharacterized protein YaaN involved in tellurite resistance
MSLSLTPPSAEPERQALVLAAPEPVPVVKEEEADDMFKNEPVDAALVQQMSGLALNFASDVEKLTPNSPAFQEKVNEINTLGAKEIVRAASAPNRLLEQRSSSVAGAKKTGDTTMVRVSKSLGDLRSTVEDLTPNQADLNAGQKILGFIPGGNRIRKYFQKYESAQDQINGIIKSLTAGKDELIKDIATLQQEKQNQWTTMGDLRGYIVFAEKIDAELVKKIDALKRNGDTQAANAIESDLLFVVRQRRQDLLTQLAVAIQGYLAMGLIQKNNEELIKGVDRSLTTTVSALRTAVIVAQALYNQKLVLDQISALNETTNKLIEGTSVMLKEQTAQIHAQASSSGVSAETLERAFANIYETMDAVDTYRVEANASMETTINNLGGQLAKARPYLERARAVEGANEDDTNRAIGA